jgi:hypothetical protein
MSRYTDIDPVATAVYRHIQPHSSLRPIAMTAVVAACRLLAPPDEIHDALEALIDARLITHMRHTSDGVTQNVYWPTGLKPINAPTLEEIHMSAEPKNSQLARLILLHGPITGPDLAEKARETGMNCPAKNIQGYLAGHVGRGDILARKLNGVTLYMTPAQAGGEAVDESEEAAAHVMSTPMAKAEETEAPVEIDALKSQIHDLLNDAVAAKLIFSQIGAALKVDQPEQMPEALDELIHALSYRAMQPPPETGRLALLLIDSADLTEIEELSDGEAENAQALAVRYVDQGHAARAVVVRIMGEAKRRVEWREAA